MDFEFEATTPPTLEDLREWYLLNEQLKKLRAQEALLRKKMFGGFFENPHEGVNTIPLNSEYLLKGEYKLLRTIDEAAFLALRGDFQQQDIDVEKLVKWKIELAVRSYKAIPTEKRCVFDQVVTTKPGTPGLAIVKVKK